MSHSSFKKYMSYVIPVSSGSLFSLLQKNGEWNNSRSSAKNYQIILFTPFFHYYYSLHQRNS